MSAARPGRVVVIGLGNGVRGDDAAGLEVARRLRRAAPAGVEVVEHEGDAAALLDYWQGAALAVVVDAVRAGGEPGSLHRLEAVPGGQAGSGIADRAWQVSSHALGLAEAVGLAGALGRLPGRLVLVGIEGGSFAAGDALSPPVAATVERAAGEVLALVTGGDATAG
jgi:hydrogenase maturation protease